MSCSALCIPAKHCEWHPREKNKGRLFFSNHKFPALINSWPCVCRIHLWGSIILAEKFVRCSSPLLRMPPARNPWSNEHCPNHCHLMAVINYSSSFQNSLMAASAAAAYCFQVYYITLRPPSTTTHPTLSLHRLYTIRYSMVLPG